MRRNVTEAHLLLTKATTAYHATRHSAPALAAAISRLQNTLAAALLSGDGQRVARAAIALSDRIAGLEITPPVTHPGDRRGKYRDARR